MNVEWFLLTVFMGSSTHRLITPSRFSRGALDSFLTLSPFHVQDAWVKSGPPGTPCEGVRISSFTLTLAAAPVIPANVVHH
jgi:hypothetical protein